MASLVLILAGCGDSGGSSVSDSNGDSMASSATEGSSTSEGSMSASMSATDPTEGGMSASGTGTTEDSGSASDSATMGGGSGNESASGSTGVDSVSGTGGTTEITTEPMTSTGEPIDCEVAQSKEECLELGCMPVEARKFTDDGAEICLEQEPTYLGCLPEMLCGQVISYICKGQNIYQAPNSCWPPDYQECEPPTDPNLGFPTC